MKEEDIKFNIGKEVFFMKDNKIQSKKIDQIELTKDSIYYYFWDMRGGGNSTFVSMGNQNSVFATKQEVLDSL